MHTKKFNLPAALLFAAACFVGLQTVSAAETPAIKADTTQVAPAGDTKVIELTPVDESVTIVVDESQEVEQPAPINETAAVEQALAQFYTGLNASFAGDSAPMQQIWSHADDVTYMGPVGGYQVGWQQVSTVWDLQTGMKLGGKIEPVATRITVGGDLASVQCIEVGNNLTADGQPEEVSIRATSLFRKENGQWKMIGHHTDLLPYLENESEETSEEAADATPGSTSDSKPETKSAE